MKIGLIILVVGLAVSILGWTGTLSNTGLTNGLATLLIGYPLIIAGVITIVYKLIKSRKN